MNSLTRFVSMVAALTLGVALVFAGSDASAQDAGTARTPIDDLRDAWAASPHADSSAEAFTHWNDEGEIPGSCAVCHSSTGLKDYVAGPMTVPGTIDHPAPLGSTVDCETCHSPEAQALTSVPFPSGKIVDSLEKSAICAVCHQGRASGATVNNATDGLEEDTVSDDLAFINIHYVASAASIMGTVTKGGYEYEDKTYKGRFSHIPELDNCTDCHNPHSLEVSLDNCTVCHQNIENFSDIRISPTDFDGDGDIKEGISNPIETMHQQLNAAIGKYASEIAGTAVVYSSHSYPYFFIDGDEDGTASKSEAIFPNKYQSWTPRLLKAAYNYQVIAKEKAIYAHNPHYALQLLYDSLESLSERVDIDMFGLARPDS